MVLTLFLTISIYAGTPVHSYSMIANLHGVCSSEILCMVSALAPVVLFRTQLTAAIYFASLAVWYAAITYVRIKHAVSCPYVDTHFLFPYTVGVVTVHVLSTLAMARLSERLQTFAEEETQSCPGSEDGKPHSCTRGSAAHLSTRELHKDASDMSIATAWSPV